MRTQRALQQAALELFATQGYDTTTTEEIAERAGVSPRTFFRYFATKESALFVGSPLWFQALTTEFLAHPRSLGDLDAIRETLVALAPSHTKGRRAFQLYERAVDSSPALRGRLFEHQQEDIAILADAIATRRGLREADEGCWLLAAVALLTYRRALTRWLDGPATSDPAEVIATEFGLLASFAAARRSPNGSNGPRVTRRPARSRTR